MASWRVARTAMGGGAWIVWCSECGRSSRVRLDSCGLIAEGLPSSFPTFAVILMSLFRVIAGAERSRIKRVPARALLPVSILGRSLRRAPSLRYYRAQSLCLSLSVSLSVSLSLSLTLSFLFSLSSSPSLLLLLQCQHVNKPVDTPHPKQTRSGPYLSKYAEPTHHGTGLFAASPHRPASPLP